MHQDRRTHYHGNKLVSRDIMVEFSVPGLFVPAKYVLYISIQMEGFLNLMCLFQELPLVHYITIFHVFFLFLHSHVICIW